MNIIIGENVFPNQHFKLVKQNIGLLQTENYPKKKIYFIQSTIMNFNDFP
jgi:hypothetical protein